MSDHLANNGKQVRILTGQGSCRVDFPMMCCLVSLSGLGGAPVWIQRWFLQKAMTSGSAIISRRRKEVVACSLLTLQSAVIDPIGDLAIMLVKKDPPKRVGRFEFKNSHAEWARLSQEGRHKMTADDHTRKMRQMAPPSTHLFTTFHVASKTTASYTYHLATSITFGFLSQTLFKARWRIDLGSYG